MGGLTKIVDVIHITKHFRVGTQIFVFPVYVCNELFAFTLYRKVSSGMEGFLVKDLTNIVERALHNAEERTHHTNTLVARRFNRSPSVDTIAPLQPKELNYEDFSKALETYKPVALRNISLHKFEDTDFNNVGGMAKIKTILIETILWPAKVMVLRFCGSIVYNVP